MDADIGPLLGDWEHEPDRIQARRITSADGRQKIQLRVELGLLQMEADGRPDGRAIGEHESLLEHHLARLEQHQATYGTPHGFALNREECAALQAEALQYYHRYVCCFALDDYQRAARDTTRNLRVFDLIREYAEDPEDRNALEQFRPYVLMMNARARAALALQSGERARALVVVDEAIQAIRDCRERREAPGAPAPSREIAFLKALRREMRDGRPATKQDRLQMQLRDAVAREDYQAAARLRDQLDAIRAQRGVPTEEA